MNKLILLAVSFMSCTLIAQKQNSYQRKSKRTIGFRKDKPDNRWRMSLRRAEKQDNTLSGYAEGETKGRAEMSYCYAVSSDFAGSAPDVYNDASRMKTVYHHGKGACAQGSHIKYRFSIYVPEDLSPDVSTIFAQWHGMPSRTLVSNPEGKVMLLTDKMK